MPDKLRTICMLISVHIVALHADSETYGLNEQAPDWAKAFSSPTTADRQQTFFVYEQEGEVKSDKIRDANTSYMWIFNRNFSSDSSTVLIKIQEMQFRVYDNDRKPYVCRRDLTFLGINLCEFGRNTCFVFTPRNSPCESIDEAEYNCEKTYWITHEFKTSLRLMLSEARSKYFPQYNWFALSYAIEKCETIRRTLPKLIQQTPTELGVTTSSPGVITSSPIADKSESIMNQFQIIIILAIALGVVFIIFISVSIAWCVRERRRAEDENLPVQDGTLAPTNGSANPVFTSPHDKYAHTIPQNGNSTTAIERANPVYAQHENTYALASPFPGQNTVNNNYDTLVI